MLRLGILRFANAPSQALPALSVTAPCRHKGFTKARRKEKLYGNRVQKKMAAEQRREARIRQHGKNMLQRTKQGFFTEARRLLLDQMVVERDEALGAEDDDGRTIHTRAELVYHDVLNNKITNIDALPAPYDDLLAERREEEKRLAEEYLENYQVPAVMLPENVEQHASAETA